MNSRKAKIVAFAYLTRVAIITVQTVANFLIPDHKADAFVSPKSNVTISVFDQSITVLLGGFLRWDSQYFMHIAKYGYTYENTLAFFPLYPLTVKVIATLIAPFAILLNEDSILLLTFVVINLYLFVKTSEALFDLSYIVLRNEDLAYKASVLFCINPASVFFVAPYTECLFSYLTFKCMLNCVIMYRKKSMNVNERLGFKSIVGILTPLSLSTCTRSNGVLNIGFIAYFTMKLYVQEFYLLKSIKERISHGIKYTILLLIIVCICLIPFALVQMYDYYHFCTNFNHSISDALVEFANRQNLVLPGMVSKYGQSWCFKKIPLVYSYIQDHYWNVGFLRYFEIKQIPNFILAFPIMIIIITNSIKFFKIHKDYCVHLGIFRSKLFSLQNTLQSKTDYCFKPEMFVFVVHALFLTLFCVMFIHVQVTTRMICSASPVVYWFAAYYFHSSKDQSNTSLKSIFLVNTDKNKVKRYILYYFVGYCFIGTVLFSNFLPWT